jgi:Na+:H+ antiporter, NhaA family
MSEVLQPRASFAERLDRVLAPFRDGGAGGAVLILAAVVSLVWANSSGAHGYEVLRHFPLGLSAGNHVYVLPFEAWVNDGLMAVFFLLVGLEIRHELVEGQLASVSRAAAPALAALGGMIVPAAIYAAATFSDPGALRGWAIPVATDIAFSLAVLRLLGKRIPAGLRVFLTALAIIDDLFAIIVIAVFYTSNVDIAALAAGGAVLAGLFLLARTGLRSLTPFLLGFLVLWACFARSGVHPTLAGVAVAFVVPNAARDGSSPAHVLEHALTGWVAYLVLPLFGLVNAGVRVEGMSMRSVFDPVVIGIALGLFLGKQVGVFGVTWLGWKLRLIRLPAQLSWPLLYGAAILCGIGFTMSLFIGHLAFPVGEREAEVKLAVFGASLVSALVGLVVLARATRRVAKTDAAPAGATAT